MKSEVGLGNAGKWRRNGLIFAALLLVAILPPVSAEAGSLFIGSGAGTTCATGLAGCFLYNVATADPEVIGLGPSGLSIFLNGNGQPTLVNPLLLILGIPTGGGVAPSITGVTSYNNYAMAFPGSPVAGSGILGGTNTYGGVWDVGTGFAGTMTALFPPPPNQVYDLVGLDPTGSSSENFGNWDAANSQVNGLTPVGYDIFVYQLTTTIAGKGLVDVDFASNIPLGTYAVAYGCSEVNAANCTSSGKTLSTPFTHAGLQITSAPEFSGSLLGMANFGWIVGLGGGLLGLAVIRRRHLPAK